MTEQTINLSTYYYNKSTIDSYFVKKSDLATVATSGSYNDLTNKPTIPTNTNQLTNGAGFVKSADLATVATSGLYNDLSSKPTIPTNTNQLTNGAGFIKSTDLASVATSGSYNDLTNKPTIPTKLTDLSATNFTLSYNSITDKPTIPTNTNQLTNGAGFVKSTDLASVATSGSYNDLSSKPTIPTKASDLTNDWEIVKQYPEGGGSDSSGQKQIIRSNGMFIAAYIVTRSKTVNSSDGWVYSESDFQGNSSYLPLADVTCISTSGSPRIILKLSTDGKIYLNNITSNNVYTQSSTGYFIYPKK